MYASVIFGSRHKNSNKIGKGLEYFTGNIAAWSISGRGRKKIESINEGDFRS